jgi:hypothetical protein
VEYISCESFSTPCEPELHGYMMSKPSACGSKVHPYFSAGFCGFGQKTRQKKEKYRSAEGQPPQIPVFEKYCI